MAEAEVLTEGRRNNTKAPKIKIENFLPTYVISPEADIKPITLARNYIKDEKIKSPCLITVADCDDEGEIIKKRGKFFWDGKCMHEGTDAQKFPGYILSCIKLNERRQQQLCC